MNAFIALLASFFLSTGAILAQTPSLPEAIPTAAPIPSSPDSLKENKTPLAALTPSERDEFSLAYQKALSDPAVQSTRQIFRMSLHKAMLQIDPAVEQIIANMDAQGPQNEAKMNAHKKNLGINFEEWLLNFPASAVTSLTSENREALKKTHAKALQDPRVQEARKTAYVIFYDAMINADPLIGPLLTKVGMPTPKNFTSLSGSSNMGSEERILGGDFQVWANEVLAPAINKEEKASTPELSPTPISSSTPLPSVEATAH